MRNEYTNHIYTHIQEMRTRMNHFGKFPAINSAGSLSNVCVAQMPELTSGSEHTRLTYELLRCSHTLIAPNTTKRSTGHGFSYETVSNTLSLTIATPSIHCETCQVQLRQKHASANRSTFLYSDARDMLPLANTQPLEIPAAAFAHRAAVIHRSGLAIEIHSSARSYAI